MKEEFELFLRFPIIWRGKCFFLASSSIDFKILLDAFWDYTDLRGIVTSRLRRRTVSQWLPVIKSLARETSVDSNFLLAF